jgi:hypothetical protein
VKKAAFSLHPGKGGFIRTTLAPINERKDSHPVGFFEAMILVALVVGAVALARFFVAH